MLKVELRAARLPGVAGFFADHYWFLIFRGQEVSHEKSCDRWEVWQHSLQNDSSWGHLHKNLLPPYQGVGNGPSSLIEIWLGTDSLPLIDRIEGSPSHYPFIHQYRYWPGPNSNTFIQWVVQDKINLSHRAIGKAFRIPVWQRNHWTDDASSPKYRLFKFGLSGHLGRYGGVMRDMEGAPRRWCRFLYQRVAPICRQAGTGRALNQVIVFNYMLIIVSL